MDASLIERLARLHGIGDAYHDYRGELKYFSFDTKKNLLRAMGCKVDDATALALELSRLEIARGRQFLPPVAAARGARIGIDIHVAGHELASTLTWSVRFEDGSRHTGMTAVAHCPEIWRGEVANSWITRRRFELPLDLPMGYHELEACVADGPVSHCLLIISPPRCYEPVSIATGGRLWGMTVQLYTLRSQNNWGIGDFDDLKMLVRWTASHGAGFIGLNPLHALAPADPGRCSPYSASNRHYLNVLYIAVPSVLEFKTCIAARDRMATAAFMLRLQQLQNCDLVDYRGVAALKFEILELLYRDFRVQHLMLDTDRAASFRAFITAGGDALQKHARFDAIDRYLRATLQINSGWLSWPKAFQDADGETVTKFALEHAEEIEFFLYVQWLAHEQLREAQALTRQLRMPIGLYGDYAVGVNPSGSETWADQGGYCMHAEIGAPPDPLALKGQGWGIPPQDPSVMQAQRLQGFVHLIRDNMRYYGALRLDHVMSLFRLWWVAGGSSPTQGAYVHYPLQQLLAVLALESARNNCLVIGEDLGVVPDEMRRAMPEYGLYHYKVLLFEQLDGRFRRPDEYVRHAIAAVATHDMPTLRSYWEGRDIQLRRRLNLYPSVSIENDVTRERQHDRELLRRALREQGFGQAAFGDEFTVQLASALHLYLARSTAALAALQIEDLLGMADPVNVPGTDQEYPNWQRKITISIEEMAARTDLAAYLNEVRLARSPS